MLAWQPVVILPLVAIYIRRDLTSRMGGLTAAYVHGTVRFAIGNESRFVVAGRKIVTIEADVKAFDDNFDFESSLIPDWINKGPVKYILGPGGNVPEGAAVVLEYRGPGRSIVAHESCFLPDASIDMWPLDPSWSPDADGRYDEGAVRAAVWKKPIAEVSAGDLVVSYDAGGRLVPGKVSRTMVNRSRHILDVFGLMMTPGHVTLCGDGAFKGRHVPVIDILRTDGALVKADDSMIRAATGCALGSDGDRLIQVVAGPVQDNGEVEIRQSAELRAGTRVILDDGRDICLLDLIEAGGCTIRADGLLDMPGQGAPVPFLWSFGETLPAPEDYVLQRSQVSLAEIYRAGDWEAVPSVLTPPERTPVDRFVTRTEQEVAEGAPNIPLNLH